MTDPITTPAQMREAAARLIDDRCADILSKQDGKIPEVDQNLRLMAVFLPDLAAAIRALPVAEPCTYKPSMDPNDAGECVNCGQAAGAHKVAEPAPVAVRVKPLVWEFHDKCQHYSSVHISGGWTISHLSGGPFVLHNRYFNDGIDRAYPTIDAAKDAANADNEARVLSQIDAVPAAQVRAEALREAATLPPYDGDGDPAGPFDHHVFVKRDAIRALIEKDEQK